MATKHAPEAPLVFTAEHAARLQELVAKVSTGDAEEADFDELKALTNTKKSIKALRESSIAQTQQSLKELNITIHDLYGKEEILTAAREYQGFTKAPAGKKPGAVAGSTRAAKGGTTLFTAPKSGRGAAATWTREQGVPATGIAKGFKALYTTHGDKFEAELLKLASPADQKWLTEDVEGKKKFAFIVDAIKTKPEQNQKKAAAK